METADDVTDHGRRVQSDASERGHHPGAVTSSLADDDVTAARSKTKKTDTRSKTKGSAYGDRWLVTEGTVTSSRANRKPRPRRTDGRGGVECKTVSEKTSEDDEENVNRNERETSRKEKQGRAGFHLFFRAREKKINTATPIERPRVESTAADAERVSPPSLPLIHSRFSFFLPFFVSFLLLKAPIVCLSVALAQSRRSEKWNSVTKLGTVPPPNAEGEIEGFLWYRDGPWGPPVSFRISFGKPSKIR